MGSRLQEYALFQRYVLYVKPNTESTTLLMGVLKTGLKTKLKITDSKLKINRKYQW